MHDYYYTSNFVSTAQLRALDLVFRPTRISLSLAQVRAHDMGFLQGRRAHPHPRHRVLQRNLHDCDDHLLRGGACVVVVKLFAYA